MFEKFDCNKCLHCKKQFILPVEPTKKTFFVLLNYPTLEQRTLKQFKNSKTWNTVKIWLTNAGISISDVYFTGGIKCYYDKSADSPEILKEKIKNCSDILLKELRVVNPKVIIALGKDAVEAMIVASGKELLTKTFLKSLGEPIKTPFGIMIPMYVPAYLEKNPNPQIEFSVDSYMKKAFACASEGVIVGVKDYGYIKTIEEFDDLVRTLNEETFWTFDIEGTSLDFIKNEIIGVGFSWKKYQGRYLPLKKNVFIEGLVPYWGSSQDYIVSALAKVFMNDSGKGAQNSKYDMKCLRYAGFDVKNLVADSMLLMSLSNPFQKRYSLDFVSQDYPDLAGYKKKVEGKELHKLQMEDLADYNNSDTDLTFRILQDCSEKLEKEPEIVDFFNKFLMPLNELTTDMEYNGVKIDTEYAEKLHRELFEELEDLEKEISLSVGVKFNIRSQDQLADVLFNKLRLPILARSKKTKEPSTGKEILEELYKKTKNESLKKIIQYRSLASIKTGFVDSFVLPKNRIDNKEKDYALDEGCHYHGNYKLISSTGRLRSGREDDSEELEGKSMNMQNMPREKRFRRLFVADEGCAWISADNSQMELRVLAEICGDKGLIDAFNQDYDIHSFVGGLLMGISYEEVRDGYKNKVEKYTKIRDLSKNIGFSWVYMAQDGLWANIFPGSTEEERRRNEKQAKERYFSRFSRIIPWRLSVIEYARNNGYIRTPLGRKIGIANLDAEKDSIRSHAEKQAVNAMIQSPASDINCMGAIIAYRYLNDTAISGRVANLIHDSIDSVVGLSYTSKFYWSKKAIMETVAPKYLKIKIKMKADIAISDRWKGEDKFSEWVHEEDREQAVVEVLSWSKDNGYL